MLSYKQLLLEVFNKLIREQTCEQFLQELASKKSTPGGGAAAALAGAIGSALSSMVCNLTIGKELYGEVEKEVLRFQENTQFIINKLLELADEDAKVFNELMSKYKLPKNTEEEKIFRAEQIMEAAINAALVPWQIAVACMEVIAIAERVANIGNKNVITDAAVSALLARAGLRSACYNVEINLPLTKDAAFIENMKEKIKVLKEKSLLGEDNVLFATERFLNS